jgi:hypothetical protein
VTKILRTSRDCLSFVSDPRFSVLSPKLIDVECASALPNMLAIPFFIRPAVVMMIGVQWKSRSRVAQ